MIEVEHGTLTPLIFTTNGSMGPECLMFHKSLADKISEKTGERYSDVMNFIRCKLSYILLKAAILCLRGSRKPADIEKLANVGDDFGLYASELRL